MTENNDDKYDLQMELSQAEQPQGKRTVAVFSTDEIPEGERQRRTANLFFGIAAIIIALTIFWVTFLLATKYTNQSDKINGLLEVNKGLQDDVNSLRAESDVEREGDACYAVYTAAITEASSNFSTNGTGLIVTMIVHYLNQDSTLPRELRSPSPDEFDAAVESSNVLRDAYVAAVDARHDWVESGSPLPCPLGSSFQGNDGQD